MTRRESSLAGYASWRRSGFLLATAIAACDRGPEPSVLSEPVGDIALRPGRLGMPSVALAAIVEARCTRAERCNQVGAGLEFPSRNECLWRVRAEWSEELNRIACERGVDEGALRVCLRALSEGSCENNTSDACRPMDVCDRAPRPPPVPLAHDPAVPG